jgi:Dolichyl-phosphate-mannose-protein mannosyltransferase
MLIARAGTRVLTDKTVDWLFAVVILVFAGLLRIAFFSGGLGTDEIVYISQAYHLLDGELGKASYVGAIRYGINAFQALSFRLFGNSVVGAAGLYFACSLGNVILTYWFAHHLWGRRAAAWAAIALAVLPIDVALAGRLNPDPYLGLFISGSVITFYFAEQNGRFVLYFLAGILAGWVFWIKEEVIIFGLIFIFLAWSNQPWRAGRLWFVLGGLLCGVANLLAFWVIFGDAFYQYHIAQKDLGNWMATQPVDDVTLWAYLRYLFVGIYHTGILGWLALAGALLILPRQTEPGRRFVLIWAGGLLLIFSLLPVSFSPLTFIRKQANYMEIFALPLALLAGWFLARQRRILAVVLGGAMITSGILLSAVEQQVVRVVAVNGRAAVEFAEAHNGTPVFGPLTAQRQSVLARLLRGSLHSRGDIRPVDDLRRISLNGGSSRDVIAYVVDDPQMRFWSGARTEAPVPPNIRECLLHVGPLEYPDLGLGRLVVGALRSALSLLPQPYRSAALRAIDPYWEVVPAEVYAVTRACAAQGTGPAAARIEHETKSNWGLNG